MRIKIKVIPGAKKERVERGPDFLKVYLTQPPVEGKANKRLIEVLAEHFDVKKYQVNIVAGHKSRQKIVEI